MVTQELLDRLEPLLLTNPQALPVEFALQVPGEGQMLLSVDPGYRLSSDDEMVARVERVTGRGSVLFQSRALTNASRRRR